MKYVNMNTKQKKYEIGEVWWVQFPFKDEPKEKRRPAVILDDDTIAILAMYVTSKEKENPYYIKNDDIVAYVKSNLL